VKAQRQFRQELAKTVHKVSNANSSFATSLNESSFIAPQNGPRLSLQEPYGVKPQLKDKTKSAPVTAPFAGDTLTPTATKMTRGVSGFGVVTGFEDQGLSPVIASDNSG